MDKNVIAPMLAGLGLGFLAFHPAGKDLARNMGQTVMPALLGSQGKDEEASAEPGKDGESDGEKKRRELEE